MSSRLPRLAVRNVGRNRRRSLITGVAIVVAVTMVMLLRGFVDGMSALMVADVVEGRSGALQVHKKGYVDSIESVPTRLNVPYTPELVAKIKAVPGVKGVTGRITFNGLVGNGVTQTMFIGRGLDLAHEEEACPRSKAVVKQGGEALDAKDTAAVLIGFELGESFGTKLGESVSVQSSSPSGRSNALDLKVKGFTVSSFPFENKRVLSVPLETAQDLLDLKGRVTEYAIGVHDLTQLEQIRSGVQAALGPEFEVHTWTEMNTFVRDIINRQNFVLGAISAVLFIIALTVIGNTMLMSVFERVREIGTLLAVGVRRIQVLQMFLIEAATIGLIGGLAGALLGRTALLVLAAMHLQIELPGTSNRAVLEPTVTPLFVVGAVLVAILGAMLASALPARRAARLNPVDALRNA
jgi:putative ABC transport system permease protein